MGFFKERILKNWKKVKKWEKGKNGEKVKGPISGIEPGPSKIFISIISIIVLLNFIITIFLVIEITSLRTKTIEALKNADDVMEALTIKQILLEPGWIDPAARGVQHMGFGFLVTGIKTKVEEGGIVVSGRIINASSVDHFNARFTLFVGRSMDADFTIDSLKSGFSAPFKVKIITKVNETVNEIDNIEVGEAGEVNLTIPKGIRLIFRGSDVAYD